MFSKNQIQIQKYIACIVVNVQFFVFFIVNLSHQDFQGHDQNWFQVKV